MAVFCLAEVSLFCFDQSVVSLEFLQKSICYTTLPSLQFSTLSVFPLPLLHDLQCTANIVNQIKDFSDCEVQLYSPSFRNMGFISLPISSLL